MKYHFLISAAASILTAQGAMAHAPSTGSATSKAKQIEAIIHGGGKPGDVVRSSSDPAVSYTVLDNGLIKRTNERYGTSEVRGPVRRWYKNHDHGR